MVNIVENQKILRVTDANKENGVPDFITTEVVEVERAKFKYYKWVNCLVILVTTLSLLYGVCATLVILKLGPELLLEPQIFNEVSDSKHLVTKELIHQRMTSRERIMVNFMKQYVELRNTFIKDEAEMKKRWMWGGILSYLSSYKVYQAFEQEYPKIEKELKDLGASRSVEILSIERIGGEKSMAWKIEFKTYDYIQKGEMQINDEIVEPEVVERYWTANIQSMSSVNRRVAYRRLLNPLGFMVVAYYQSEIEL